MIATGHVLGKMNAALDGQIYIVLTLYQRQMMLDPQSWSSTEAAYNMVLAKPGVNTMVIRT
jgi:hypothetical protein